MSDTSVRVLNSMTIPAQVQPCERFDQREDRNRALGRSVQDWHDTWHPTSAEKCDDLLRIVVRTTSNAHSSEIPRAEYTPDRRDGHWSLVCGMARSVLADLKAKFPAETTSRALLIEALANVMRGILGAVLEEEAELNKETKE